MKTLLLILVFFTGNAEAATRNFIPRGTGEGYIGLSTRAWAGVYADQFWGSGAGLTSLPAGELTGTVPTGSVDLSTVTANHILKAGDTMTGDLSLPGLTATYGVSAATGVFTTLYGDGSNLTGVVLAESDPIVGAISGIVKADGGGNISAAAVGTDYLAPDGDGSGLSGVIQSTATGTYALRVATATYLATAPGACGEGEFINALTADGTKTCATPSGGGDVVLASTQTFTGANTFSGVSTFSGLTTVAANYALWVDSKAYNADGGTNVATTWTDRILNTEMFDTGGFGSLKTASVSNSSVTLNAGTYFCEWSSPFLRTGYTSTRLYNKTTSAIIGVGSSLYQATIGDYAVSVSHGKARFSLSSSADIAIQYYTASAYATQGLGTRASSTADSYSVFTILYCVKEQ